MQTTHQMVIGDSGSMTAVGNESVDLVVTSPPYPMIEMWDASFTAQDQGIGACFDSGRFLEAFEGMHRILDRTWKELYRVLRVGGIACINIGDAVRTLDGNFRLFCNHSRILERMLSLGFSGLPNILWRKQTNAPNKFMGSGMMPPGAYVTLEHEYILILRKGPKREFRTEAEKAKRRESAFFWEERNVWFSDVWTDLKGTTQVLNHSDTRSRSGAFPFELPYRLISMFSLKGDTVLDPFAGTGTTSAAALTAARSSIGYEREPGLQDIVSNTLSAAAHPADAVIRGRLDRHRQFIRERVETKGPTRYVSKYYGFPVVTNQETQILINELEGFRRDEEGGFVGEHADGPGEALQWETAEGVQPGRKESSPDGISLSHVPDCNKQRSLF